MREAAAIGMFDGVHLGHEALLHRLCALADERGLQPVAYTFDSHPLEIVNPAKSPMLLTSPDERCRLIKGMSGHHIEARILHFDDGMRVLTAEQFLTKLHAEQGVDMLLMGFNHRFGHDRVAGFDAYRAIADRIGMEVKLCDDVVEVDGAVVSSSAIRSALLSSDLPLANAMLGRCYAITGAVAHGKGIGHTIGFPTANVVPPFERKLIPAEGVYAAFAEVQNADFPERIPAMVNIGRRPTIEGRTDATLSIEAHLIGVDADLYGATMTLSFVAYIRPERRFANLDALKAQLMLDRETALGRV